MKTQSQLWDLWYPKAAATGVPFARGRLDATEILFVHAAPPVLTSKCGVRRASVLLMRKTCRKPTIVPWRG